MTWAVLIILVDGRKVFYDDAYISGVADSALLLSPRQSAGVGIDIEVVARVPLAQVERAEIVTKDSGREADDDWFSSW